MFDFAEEEQAVIDAGCPKCGSMDPCFTVVARREHTLTYYPTDDEVDETEVAAFEVLSIGCGYCNKMLFLAPRGGKPE